MLHHVSMCIVTDVLVGPSASILSSYLQVDVAQHVEDAEICACGNCELKCISVTRVNCE